MNCPHCQSTLLWSDDRGAHCDGCDDFQDSSLAASPGSFADLEILNVPAGRDLDAMAAEHLLGWRWIAALKCLGSVELEDARIVREHWERMIHKDVTNVQRPERAADWDNALPHYSTSGDALEILQAMNDRNYQYQILKTPKQCHMVSFTSRSGTTDESAFDDSLPEAICHAALRAVQREQKNKD